MVSEMNDYSFILSEATSYPFDATGPKQKLDSFKKQNGRTS
jgi:hypothetical protein